MNHEGKCASLHGHNGRVEVQAVAPQGLDLQGRIIDFSVLKERIGGWIETHWDHSMILCADDTETISLVRQCPGTRMPFLLPYNPTAEHLAQYLLWEVCPRVMSGTSIIVTTVELWETVNCSAVASEAAESVALLNCYHKALSSGVAIGIEK